MSEGFRLWEEHTSVAHGISLHIVEVAVGVCLVVVVEAVGSQGTDENGVFHLWLRDICKINACSVALVFDIQSELGLLDVLGEIIHVFHHQSPVCHHRCRARVLQRLDKQGLGSIGIVGCKLTHLIGHSTVCVFERHSQYLVGLKCCLQTDISQGTVECVFRRGEQSCALHLFIIHTTRKSSYSIQHGVGLVDVTGGSILSHHRRILTVGIVARHNITLSSPHRVTKVTALAQVGESHDITCIARRSCLVCHPYLHTSDLDTGHQVRQC